MANYILTMLGDRMEMAHSIEGRVPFLDHKLVEKLVSMPVNQKIRGMTEKFVLREAVKDVVTDTIYRREKHPFLSPPATLNPNDGLSALVQDTLRGEGLRSTPFFNQQNVVALLDRIPQMDTATRTVVDPLLMGMVSVCVLQKSFGMSASG
jgi:asparagine synthase (glutamine-hydrolysing)